MAKGAICSECGQETFAAYRCMKCKQEFCRGCFDVDGAGWLCLTCSRAEAVGDDRPPQGSLLLKEDWKGVDFDCRES